MSKDIFIHSAESLNQETPYTCASRPPSRPYKYHLYPIKLISALNTVLQARKDNDTRLIQYIVSPQNELLLTQEGPPSTFIPTHKEMKLKPTSTKVSVLAAGYLFLNSAGEIIGISNESEDFKEQSLLSLLRPVAILHIMKAPIAKNFSVIPNTPDTHQFELTAEDRQEIVEKLPLNFIKVMLAANQKTKVITREPAPSTKVMLGAHREILFTMQSLMTESRTIEQHDEFHYQTGVECAN
jgi:hypothetical protein